MLPTKKTPPKTSIADLTILLHGKPKFGKCLAGDTLLYDPTTGRPVTLATLVEGGSNDVITMREAAQLVRQKPTAYIRNEPAQLFCLTTQTGRRIEATANHPFLTRTGWKPLESLGIGDRVAVVAEYPNLFGSTHTDDALLKILAYLIADGSLGDGSPIFTKADPEVRLDFEAAVEAKGDECIEYVNDRGIPHVRVRGKRSSPNNVIAFLKEVGLHGLRSADKFIPDFVFGLRKSKLALFLNRLFTCDGSIEASGRVSYSSTSIRLVRQVQHLLLRFGIVSIMRPRYRDGELYGAEILVSSKDNVLAFIDEIGCIGEKAVRAQTVRAALYNVRAAETQLDRIGPILFDRIASIEPTVVAPVYDLTVEGTHNFVANDFIVHNSSFCAQAPGALFLATEAGLNHLEVFQAPIRSWEDLLAACAEIAAGKHDFKIIVIDTVDNAYRMCVEHILGRHKVDHESDLPYGKGYALVNNEFHRVLTKLSHLPYGLILVSHSQEKEFETRTGKVTRIVPTLPDKARKVVLGLVDLILYCDAESTPVAGGRADVRRVLRTKPNAHYEAGDRTGRLPDVIDLDFQKFLGAFSESSTRRARREALGSGAGSSGSGNHATTEPIPFPGSDEPEESTTKAPTERGATATSPSPPTNSPAQSGATSATGTARTDSPPSPRK